MHFPARLQNRHAGAVLILSVPIILWAIPLLLSGSQSITADGDSAFYFYPLLKVGMDQWHHGIVPLWTNLIQCGFPLLADGQAGLCYPITLLANLVLPLVPARNGAMVFQLVLTAIFMYSFLVQCGFTRRAAVLGGWLWVFSGPIAGTLGSPQPNGITWWPLWFLLAGRIASKPDPGSIAAAGLAFGFAWLGGFPQTAFYGELAASTYLVFLLASNYRGRLRACLPGLAGWAFAATLGMGIAALQLLPTLEMSKFSVRSGGLDFAAASQASMLPTGLVSVFIPDWTSHLFSFGLVGISIFMGLIPLAMAGAAIDKRMNRRVMFFIGLLVVGCLLSFGKYTPLYRIVCLLPGFSSFRAPFRFLYLSYFALVILSAEGFNRFCSPVQDSLPEIRRLFLCLCTAVGTSLFACCGGAILLHFSKNGIAKIALRPVRAAMMKPPHPIQTIDFYISKTNSIIAAIEAALNPANRAYLISTSLAIVAIILLAAGLRRPRYHRPITIGLMTLAVITLAGLGSNPYTFPTRKSIEPPQLADFYAKQYAEFRIYNVRTQDDMDRSTIGYCNRLDADYNMLFNVAQVGEYGALGSYRYFKLLGSLGSVNLAFGFPPATENDVKKGLSVLSLCNVRYIASTSRLTIPGLTQEPFDSFFLYRNNSVMPRAFVVPKAEIISDPEALLDSLHSPGFDPGSRVFLESDPQRKIANGIRSVPDISFSGDQRIGMEADGPGWLVLTDLFYPGWKALLDGHETPICRADYVFRALPLPEGHHFVEFYFESESFRHGVIISAASLLVILVLLCAGRFFQKRTAMSSRD